MVLAPDTSDIPLKSAGAAMGDLISGFKIADHCVSISGKGRLLDNVLIGFHAAMCYPYLGDSILEQGPKNQDMLVLDCEQK